MNEGVITDPAVARSMELMQVPQKDLPPYALAFARKLIREVGGCMEVYITAFAVYAQCVEGLPCDDDLYKARPQDVEWFRDQQIYSDPPFKGI